MVLLQTPKQLKLCVFKDGLKSYEKANIVDTLFLWQKATEMEKNCCPSRFDRQSN